MLKEQLYRLSYVVTILLLPAINRMFQSAYVRETPLDTTVRDACLCLITNPMPLELLVKVQYLLQKTMYERNNSMINTVIDGKTVVNFCFKLKQEMKN